MVTLLILDGYGFGKEDKNNAIYIAKTPVMDRIRKEYPSTTLRAAEEYVGLIPNQMGNSEVGHLNLGAGRIVFQDLAKINNAIKDGTFYQNKAFLNAIEHCKKNNSNLHLMGLLSDGGVHSNINHLKEILKTAKNNNLKNVYLHLITDGRDVFRDSSPKYITEIEDCMKSLNIGEISSVIGRIYAMDRERRYDRLQEAYNLFVYGKGDSEIKIENLISEIKKQHEKGTYDEFIRPIKIESTPNIKDNDSVIFFNYRTDRAREISEALSQKYFNEFPHEEFKNLHYVCMTQYDEKFQNVDIAFPPALIKNTLSEVLASNNLTQYRVTETTKYAHITFFFNGGIEKPYKGENRELVESINVKDFSEFPKMRAEEITEKACKAIESKKYDFILINLSNPDMIGHTGNFDAAVEAIECIDKCVDKLVKSTLKADADILVTADHGNAELMADDQGNVITSHTTNLVPFVLVSEKHKNEKLIENGKLANVSPTVLKLLNVEIPKEMDEKPLF